MIYPSSDCDELIIKWTGEQSVSYRVHINDNKTLIVDKNETILSDLTANTEYTVTVVAVNELGDGGNVTGTGRTRPEGLGNIMFFLIICRYFVK